MIISERRRLLDDGRPRLVLAGEIHYFRVPRERWRHVVDLLAATGADTVSSYIPWLWHELPDGSIDLTGRTRPERDLGEFIDLCAEAGLDFLARPGPFQMAELKQEGLPARLFREHPEIAAVGWDGRPATSADVDLAAPAFLAEARRWYDAVLPVLADRRPSVGGRLAGVQLDNEIGMLSWVANTPVLTDRACADFGEFLSGVGHRQHYPAVTGDAWCEVVRSPSPLWAARLRADLAAFARRRHATYVATLAEWTRSAGVVDVPLYVNIHGTTGGDGRPFGIGVSQLADTWAGDPGILPGSDHYVGDPTRTTVLDLHFITASMAAAAPGRALTSLEFEAGTGDYGEGVEELYDPSTVRLSSHLAVAQGVRLINFYLFAGGTNPPLDEAAADGNDRIGTTGLRHGTAAPVGWDGEPGPAYEATAATIGELRAWSDHLADADEETDDVALGWSAAAFATEHRHPRSAEMATVVADLERFRGPGPRRALSRALLYGGYRFSAVDIARPDARLPRSVVMAGGRVVAADVQRRLVDHVTDGGLVIWLGRAPDTDVDATPCRILADAAGVQVIDFEEADHRRFTSVAGTTAWPEQHEVRVGWREQWRAEGAEVLLRDHDGAVCGITRRIGSGTLIMVGAELPGVPGPWRALWRRHGLLDGLDLRTSVTGVVATTTRSARRRVLHLVNPTGHAASVRAAGVERELGPRSVELIDLPVPGR